MTRALAVLLVLVFFAPVSTYAVLIPESRVLVQIIATPTYPKPNQLVSLQAHVPGDSSSYTFSWYVNDDLVSQGGTKSIAVPAGGLGAATRVDVIVSDASGTDRGGATYALRPANVDIVWEGNTFVPVFYSGLPLPNKSSSVKVLAMPSIVRNGVRLDSSQLIFEWSSNGKKLVNQSGKGKSSATISPPSFTESFPITVKVSTADSAVTAEGGTLIPLVSSLAVVYESEPLNGLATHKAVVGTASLTEDEKSFEALPYFVNDVHSLEYTWTFDGDPFILDETKPRIATFRRTAGGSGAFAIGFTFENLGTYLEKGIAQFTLQLKGE